MANMELVSSTDDSFDSKCIICDKSTNQIYISNIQNISINFNDIDHLNENMCLNCNIIQIYNQIEYIYKQHVSIPYKVVFTFTIDRLYNYFKEFEYKSPLQKYYIYFYIIDEEKYYKLIIETHIEFLYLEILHKIMNKNTDIIIEYKFRLNLNNTHCITNQRILTMIENHIKENYDEYGIDDIEIYTYDKYPDNLTLA